MAYDSWESPTLAVKIAENKPKGPKPILDFCWGIWSEPRHVGQETFWRLSGPRPTRPLAPSPVWGIFRAAALQKCGSENFLSVFLCQRCHEIWREIFRATFSRVWVCDGKFHQNFTSKTVWKTENFAQISLCWGTALRIWALYHAIRVASQYLLTRNYSEKIIPWQLLFVIFEGFCALEMSRKVRHFHGIAREILFRK